MFLAEPPASESGPTLCQEDRASDGCVDNFTRLWGWRPDLSDASTEVLARLPDQSALTPVDVAARSDFCALAWRTRFADRFDSTLLIALRMAFPTVNGALGAHPDAKLAQATPPVIRATVGYGRPPSDTRSI